MIYLGLGIVLLVALLVVQKDFSTAAASDDLTKLSKGKLKQNIAFARMIVKNGADQEKRAEAAQAIEKLQGELGRRQAD